ncbi:hypothetical protein [Convivina praedatoris]|uniref:Holin n=1 Tax=Convivina praedatoris TaxID=2880963 RepID=A0ABM9D1V5_9LACO|nr:hypothetical protein [Convivina sp. LMG 32447]CAH1853352.1 hypothetical protein R077815_00808 [Convivina sp. LMG 32447]CAH1854721.1 hypothetical protein LMG032447_00922 [Convivina sp. LMG 32447]
MKRHILLNEDMIITAWETIMLGLVILVQSQQLHHRLPPILDWTDDVSSGMIFLVLGILVLVNAVWDFYWYRIRVVLLSSMAFLWSTLAASFLLDDLSDHHITIVPLLFITVVVRIMLIAKREPPYKMNGGDHG